MIIKCINHHDDNLEKQNDNDEYDDNIRSELCIIFKLKLSYRFESWI